MFSPLVIWIDPRVDGLRCALYIYKMTLMRSCRSLVLEKNRLFFHISALAYLVNFVGDAYAVQDAADQK